MKIRLQEVSEKKIEIFNEVGIERESVSGRVREKERNTHRQRCNVLHTCFSHSFSKRNK